MQLRISVDGDAKGGWLVDIHDGDFHNVYSPAIASDRFEAAHEAIERHRVESQMPVTSQYVQDFLREDGPTLSEYVKAGFPAVSYPPIGCKAKPMTPEEVEIYDAARAQGGLNESAQRAS